jgi:hypothetical protein
MKADSYYAMNTDIPGMKPIYLSLPEQPPDECIDGYELPIEEQYFRRIEIPVRITQLVQNVETEYKQKELRDKNFRATGQVINEEVKRRFEDEQESYKEEILWIKHQWWYRIYGYWYFNYGKPTYIDGVHWYFLNYGFMPASDSPSHYPEYRDADRRRFHFYKYTKTTTETFKYLDKDGNAIANKDGSYDMIDKKFRVCYGDINPKSRRCGGTYHGITDLLEFESRTNGTHGGIQSYSEDNASSHYEEKLIPMWQQLPFYFKPIWEGNNAPDKGILFNKPANKAIGDSLGSRIDYATTAEATFYNGKQLYRHISDEEGQQGNKPVDIFYRWSVNKQTLTLGGKIIGWSHHPSNVLNMSKGGEIFFKLFKISDFYNRNSITGQTTSGLFAFMEPAYRCMERFVGKYGESIEDAPTKLQIKNGFIGDTGAKKWIEDQIRQDLERNTPESIQHYIEHTASWPRNLEDIFRMMGGDLGFDIEILDKRIMQLSLKEETMRGNFEWTDGFGSRVQWFADSNGRAEVSELLSPERSNLKTYEILFDPTTGVNRKVYRPLIGGCYMAGIDATRWEDPNSAMERIIHQHKSKLSDYGGAILKQRDVVTDPTEDMRSWQTYRFVYTYLHRPISDEESHEDMLKACIYYGAKMFPETNVEHFIKFIYRHGYEGYFQYRIDPRTGRRADRPGAYMGGTGDAKQELFKRNKDYIKFRGHQERHLQYLLQCRRIKSFDEMKRNDLFTASGLALMGAHCDYTKEIESSHNYQIELKGVFKKRKY